MVAAHGVAQTEAHRLIERLMILNNEQVAQLLERERVPAIYRVHAQPDAARIERLLEQLAALGVPTPPLGRGLAPQRGRAVAAEASRLVRREAARRGHGREAYTSLVLRSLKQAYYSERNIGHAGLGSPAYCHFTSPIRRYPDLVCHRALLALLGEGEEAPTLAEARDAAADCSARERESAQIERHADDVCAAYLLERELGERGLDAVFEGEVSGVIRSAAFVSFRGELGDVYEGMLPARRLPGEHYELDRGRGGAGRARVGGAGAASAIRYPSGSPGSTRRGDGPSWSRLGRQAEPMAKKQKKKREPASGDVVTQPPRPPQIRVGREDGGRDRPAGLRGEGAARWQSPDDRRLRGRRQRRGLASQAAYPALRVRRGRRPSRPSGRASYSSTRRRSSAWSAKLRRKA